jgi:chromate transporter
MIPINKKQYLISSSLGVDLTKPQISQISAWQLFRIWAAIGLQSFGGGASTTFLIQHAFIDKYKAMTMDEFIRFWSLCVMTPGINLVALTVLIGRKFAGTRGIIASLAGLLVPSATITCLLAAGFRLIQSSPAVQAILRGIIPATAGIMLLVGLNFAQPLFKQAYKEGTFRLLISAAIILIGFIAIIVFHASVILVLLGSALLSMMLFTAWHKPEIAPVEGLTPTIIEAASKEEDTHD